MKQLIAICLAGLVTACAHLSSSSESSLYDALGGAPTVEKVTDYFIDEISFDRAVFAYFKDSDIARFREKFIEHFCATTGGPCAYTGDDMHTVHRGMQINEADFNRTVDCLIAAMTRAGIAHRLQNQVLQRLAPMREEMLYQ
ncbi:MAG: group 1 truncated hemoglobin [Oleiphilaceae bacterium]|nr:group 1 truncated hemoglobin [Oleiphilaceae bacterium]